jgi:hypothetical protein
MQIVLLAGFVMVLHNEEARACQIYVLGARCITLESCQTFAARPSKLHMRLTDQHCQHASSNVFSCYVLQGAWQPLFAPATTVALHRAVGDFCVADMLQAALEGKHSSAGAAVQPAAAEAAGSSGCASPVCSNGSALSDSSWEVL